MTVRPASILCIDDDPFSRTVLRAILENAAYLVDEADNPAAGHELALDRMPDVILLDVMLPRLEDSFHLCSKLKADARTKAIPIIFVSANADPRWITDGLRLGAVDYVTKPVYAPELLMRVDLHLRIRAQEKQLLRYATQLEAMVAERTQSLLHADRLASIGTLAAGIAHEINNPTSVIRGNAETLAMYWSAIEPVLRTHLADTPDARLCCVLEETTKVLDAMKRSTDRIATIVRGLLQFGARRHTEKRPVNLESVISEALALVNSRLKHHCRVERTGDHVPPIWGNECELAQVLVNLLTNAADAIGDRGGHIRIMTSIGDGVVELAVEDDGPGLPHGCLQRVLEPFFTTKDVGSGTGLGLPICVGIVEDHGGRFELSNRPGGGCRAALTLPLARPADAISSAA